MNALLFLMLATAAALTAWGIGAALGALVYRLYWLATRGERRRSFVRTLRIARAARRRGEIIGRAAEQRRLEARAAAMCRVIDQRLVRVNGEGRIVPAMSDN